MTWLDMGRDAGIAGRRHMMSESVDGTINAHCAEDTRTLTLTGPKSLPAMVMILPPVRVQLNRALEGVNEPQPVSRVTFGKAYDMAYSVGTVVNDLEVTTNESSEPEPAGSKN